MFVLKKEVLCVVDEVINPSDLDMFCHYYSLMFHNIPVNCWVRLSLQKGLQKDFTMTKKVQGFQTRLQYAYSRIKMHPVQPVKRWDGQRDVADVCSHQRP
jgi:hypothetical protein